jgi:hypothetical protein
VKTSSLLVSWHWQYVFVILKLPKTGANESTEIVVEMRTLIWIMLLVGADGVAVGLDGFGALTLSHVEGEIHLQEVVAL